MGKNQMILGKTNEVQSDVVYQDSENPVAVYLATLGASSRDVMRTCLGRVASIMLGVNLSSIEDRKERKAAADDAIKHLEWHKLGFAQTNLIRATLAEQYAPATVNLCLTALKGVLKSCWRLGLTSAEDYQKAIDVKSVRRKTLPSGRMISQDEVVQILGVCTSDKTFTGIRDACLVTTMLSTGMRRAEISKLDLADFNEKDLSLKVLQSKGNKDRLVYLAGGAIDHLDDWLAIRGRLDGPLFHPIKKGDKIQFGSRLSAQAVYYILNRRCIQAGVLEKTTPHDFRRSFITNLIENGADIFSVAYLAGHSSVDTTRKYDQTQDKRAQAAMELLDVPYVGAGIEY